MITEDINRGIPSERGMDQKSITSGKNMSRPYSFVCPHVDAFIWFDIYHSSI
jgi:hypothetical protein